MVAKKTSSPTKRTETKSTTASKTSSKTPTRSTSKSTTKTSSRASTRAPKAIEPRSRKTIEGDTITGSTQAATRRNVVSHKVISKAELQAANLARELAHAETSVDRHERANALLEILSPDDRNALLKVLREEKT